MTTARLFFFLGLVLLAAPLATAKSHDLSPPGEHEHDATTYTLLAPEARALHQDATKLSEKNENLARSLKDRIDDLHDSIRELNEVRANTMHATQAAEAAKLRAELERLHSHVSQLVANRTAAANRDKTAMEQEKREEAHQQWAQQARSNHTKKLEAEANKAAAEDAKEDERVDSEGEEHKRRLQELAAEQTDAKQQEREAAAQAAQAQAAARAAKVELRKRQQELKRQLDRAVAKHEMSTREAQERLSRMTAKFQAEVARQQAEEQGRKRTREAHARRMADEEAGKARDRAKQEEERKQQAIISEQKHKLNEEDRKSTLR